MSHSSSSSSSDQDEDFTEFELPEIKTEGEDEVCNLEPYLFEPTRKVSSSEEDVDENDSEGDKDSGSSVGESRLNDLDW